MALEPRSVVVCGIDIGGSSWRARLAVVEDRGRIRTVGPDVVRRSRVGSPDRGGDVLSMVEEASAAVAGRLRDGAGRVRAICVDSAGISSLVSDADALAWSIARVFEADVAVLAPDALAAHSGALSGGPGVVVAVGTGSIALGTDHRTVWRRCDGWGPVLGDCGSGAWIGRRGLRAALDAYEGRGESGSAPLLAEARELFGDPPSWPRMVASGADAVRRVASFAAVVSRCAGPPVDDGVARTILMDAGDQIARTAAAAWCEGLPRLFSYTGGVLTSMPRVREGFLVSLPRIMPEAAVLAPAGDALDGAVRLAALAVGSGRHGVPAPAGCLVVERKDGNHGVDDW